MEQEFPQLRHACRLKVFAWAYLGFQMSLVVAFLSGLAIGLWSQAWLLPIATTALLAVPLLGIVAFGLRPHICCDRCQSPLLGNPAGLGVSVSIRRARSKGLLPIARDVIAGRGITCAACGAQWGHSAFSFSSFTS